MNSADLAALLICPDRQLAEEFIASQARAYAFQVVADLKSYPSQHTLEIRLKQLRPDIVLLDVTTNPDGAGEIIRFISELGLPVQVVGLSPRNEPEILLSCLRLGASEFLHSPFDPASQQEAVSRLLRLRQPDAGDGAIQPGSVVVFSSVKPGSGASTIAVQTAFALRKTTSRRILLADFDLLGGAVAFYSKLNHTHSLLDALENADQLASPIWASLITDMDGIDVLQAPPSPYEGRIETARLLAVLEYARMNYDCVLIDLPVIFERLSLMVLSNAERAFLVSTAELPSLHLTRKAVQLLDHLGFPKERFQVLLNRVNRKEDLSRAELEKLLQCPVEWRLPNDYFSLHRVVTLGHPLDEEGDLGKAIRQLSARLVADPASRTPGVGSAPAGRVSKKEQDVTAK